MSVFIELMVIWEVRLPHQLNSHQVGENGNYRVTEGQSGLMEITEVAQKKPSREWGRNKKIHKKLGQVKGSLLWKVREWLTGLGACFLARCGKESRKMQQT